MFEKLIDVILQFIDDLKLWVVVPIYDEVVLLRLGKFYKLCKPGIHFKLPFADQPYPITVVTRILAVPVQSLITKDRRQLAVRAIVKYHIDDAQLHLEKIYDAEDGLTDLTRAYVMKIINPRLYEECMDTEDLSNEISKKLRAEVKKYGIYVEQVTLTDLVEAPSYRLFMDNCESNQI